MHQHGGGNRTTEIGYKEKKIFKVYTYNMKLGLVADPVIEAIARLEFEDSLRTEWLEDGSPPWRLLGPLERPHLT